ncbi:MAG: hypothetical protein P4L91_08530 [Burkholderiaceae bacterium]|nr:hypothetical protein [Burkholderiaceae bacterium]
MTITQRLRALFLCAIAALMAACHCSGAYAVEIKVDAGILRYTPAPCGNWYQCTDSTPYTLRLTALSGSVGVYTDPFASGWQLGGGVGNGGVFSSHATVCDVDGPCPAWSLSYMEGSGSDPYVFVDLRRTLGKLTLGVQAYDSFMSYDNTNYNWHNVNNQSQPAVVSRTEHAVKGTFGIGLSASYALGNGFSVIGKLIPTAANNSQFDPVSRQQTWYRPVASSAIGYSPFVGIEYTY